MAFFEDVYRTARQLANENPILPLGDIWIEKDTGKAKRGNGASPWSALPYWAPAGATNVVDAASLGVSKHATPAVNRAAFQAALDQHGAGAGPLLVPNIDFTIDGPVTPPSGSILYLSQGTVIRQATQFQPVFDLFDVDNVSIMGGTLINDDGPPSSTGSSFRGDSGYAYSAGVWANGERHTVQDVRIVDFGVGVYFNSSDGSSNTGDHVQRVGNTVRDVEVSGCNFGVLFLNQNRLLIDGLYCHDLVDSSAGTNPMHGIYGTGAATDTSNDITIVNCSTVDCSTGVAYQIKYATNVVLGNLSADDCLGLFNGMDIYDVVGTNLSSIGDLATTASFTTSFVVATNARLNFTNVSIIKAVESTQEVRLICNDSRFANFTLQTLKDGANTNAADVQLDGNRITVDGFKLRNSGSSNAGAFYMGSGADHTISNFECDNYRRLVDIDSTMTGLNIVDYAPFAQRRISFGTGTYVNALSGTPPFKVTRRECTNTYSPVSGNLWPLAGLETTSRFTPTSSAFTVQLPQIGARTGIIHEIVIANTTGGALGAATWDAGYVFKSGSAPSNPSSGAAISARFLYDGTSWREL